MMSSLNSFSHKPSVSYQVSKYTISQQFTSSHWSSDISCPKYQASVTLYFSERRLSPCILCVDSQFLPCPLMLTSHQLLQNPAVATSRLQLLIVWTGYPKDSIKNCALDALGPLLESLGAPLRHGGALNDFSILGSTQSSVSTKWSRLLSRP